MRIWNKHREKPPADAVYVGRPTKFGNPFPIGKAMTRAESIERFREYINHHPLLQEAARRELRGKDLVCFCAPLACHAEILAEIANDKESQ